MDKESLNLITNMQITLNELAAKGTTTAVHSKIQSVKLEKNMEIVRNTYDEIINQILSEREEAVTIAQAYKEELDKVVISDEDINHLHNTVSKILEILKLMTPDNKNLDSVEQLKELISIDTLKTMQLLGFNYKRAIGEPLTSLCSDAILNLGSKGKPTKKK